MAQKPGFLNYVVAAFNARPFGMFVAPNWVGLAAMGLLGIANPAHIGATASPGAYGVADPFADSVAFWPRLLDRLTEEEWLREGTHTEVGPYGVIKWLEIYARHAHSHARQMVEAIDTEAAVDDFQQRQLLGQALRLEDGAVGAGQGHQVPV